MIKKKQKKISKPAKKKLAAADTIKRIKIRVIGIGGGAGSIISEIACRIKKANFVVANTDLRALKIVKKAKRFQFGQSLTGGLGTGMNPEIGETAALQEKDKIKKLFEGQDLCIIVACLGGGTGSGATPIFAKISKNLGCFNYGIFTLPFEFEGVKKMDIAREALLKIKPHLNAFSVLPNERIFKIIDKNTPLKDALSTINKRLAENLEGLIEMIYFPGLINIDFADLRTILSGRGRLAYLNAVEIEKTEKGEAPKKLISSPLYPYSIKGARGILYNIVGRDSLLLSEVSQISEAISELVNKNAKIIFGISRSPKYRLPAESRFQQEKAGDKIKITLLATGCGTKGVLLKRKKIVQPIVKKAVKEAKKPKPKLKSKPGILSKASKLSKVPKIKVKKISQPKKMPEPLAQDGPVPTALYSAGGKIRRTGLQLKKVVEQEEKEILEQEKIWETPAILRKK